MVHGCLPARDGPVNPRLRPPRWQLVLGFLCIYLVWGTTYLAIRMAIETLPPLLMAGVRWVIAGSLLWGWSAWKGEARATWTQLGVAAASGLFLLLGGNGGVTWAEQRVPSGVTSLIVASIPLWIALLETWLPGGRRLTPAAWGGVLMGLVGLALLIGPERLAGGERYDLTGVGVLLVGCTLWAAGTVFQKRWTLPTSPIFASAVMMLAGGSGLAVLGAVLGEGSRFHPAEVSARSWAAMAYLVVFGSAVGFSTYTWLLRAVSPQKAATYAYINPVVAVIAGWLWAGEALNARVILPMLVICAAVAILIQVRSAEPKPVQS